MSGRCKELMKTSLAKYEAVCNSFSRFFDSDDLNLALERKADIGMVAKVDDLKASKQELQQSKAMVESLNDRVKHLSILQQELASLLMPIRESMNGLNEQAKTQMLTKLENLQS